VNEILDTGELLKEAEDFIQAIWPLEAIPAEVWAAFGIIAAGGLLILLVYILSLWAK
jgi:hypothetical protein